MATSRFSIDENAGRSFGDGASRPFGSAFPGQNPVYLIYMPLALMAAAMVIWLVPSNETFVLGATIGGLAGLYILGDVVLRTVPIRFSLLLAMAMLVGYNLGAFNSWLTVPRAGLTIPEYFARDPEALARAVGASMGSASLLLALGQVFERPLFGDDFHLEFDGRSVVLIVFSTLLVVAAFSSGQMGYMGISHSDTGRVNPLISIVIWLSIPAFAYSVCACLNTRGAARWLIVGCTLVQGVALIPIGRRNIAYGMLLSMIALRLGQYRNRLSLAKKLLVGAAALVVIVLASVAFLYLRVAGYGHKGSLPNATRFALALDTLEKRSPLELAGTLGNDAATRTFDIGYFSDLLEASQRSTPLLGLDLLQSAQSTVPSIISPDKFGMVPYGEEDLVNMHWGFSYIDEANTLLTAGAADFGILGVIFYPLFAVMLLRLVAEWAQAGLPTFGAAVIGLAFTQQMLFTEQAPGDDILQVRSAIIFAVLIYIISMLPKFNLREGGHHQ